MRLITPTNGQKIGTIFIIDRITMDNSPSSSEYSVYTEDRKIHCTLFDDEFEIII